MGIAVLSLESMEVNRAFWAGKRVLVTGHTGFKGSWLTLWLKHLGADVTGVALAPMAEPNLYSAAAVGNDCRSYINDIRDDAMLAKTIEEHQVDIVFHLAAQSLVLPSYEYPVETFSVNAIGTAAILQAIHRADRAMSCVVVTSDKCYENQEWVWAYREDDALGGHDPYSASKACAELVTASFMRAFFDSTKVSVATARSGNVVGGGDWSSDRLIPDIVRSYENGMPLSLRNPGATRPWQHVLEPLHGYLMLAEALSSSETHARCAWNFGPDVSHERDVDWVATHFIDAWGQPKAIELIPGRRHEAHALALDSSKARRMLNWQPRLDIDTTIAWTARWYWDYLKGSSARALCIQDISAYMELL